VKPQFLAICRQYQFIFIHVPKAGGISLQTALFGQTGLGHDSLADFQGDFSADEFISFFKFAIVRNPWGRLLSAFTYLKAGGRNAQDRAWSAANLSDIRSFEQFVMEWLREETLDSIAHFTPQSSFLRSKESRVSTDFIGHFERLPAAYQTIRGELATRGLLSLPEHLPHLNVNPIEGMDYRTQFSTEAQRKVANLYREDIELFGYKFD
jgi:hypothetical protein